MARGTTLPVRPSTGAAGAVAIAFLVGTLIFGWFPLQTLLVPVVLLVVVGLVRSVPVSLTRRGWSVVGVAHLGLWMALWFGTRSLEALVVPMGLAVLAAAIAVARAERPEVNRTLPENGHVEESRTVRLNLEVDTPEAGVVHDTVGEGLSATGNRVDTTLGTHPIEYEITFESRGVHRLGPLSVSVRDVLGLASTTFEYPRSDEVVAYPAIRPLSGATRRELNLLAGGAPERERDEFHRLREYVSGDSLRDVHWKTSAKQPDDELVVKEFVAEDQFGDVQVLAEGPGAADRVAEATASIVVNLLERGVNVGVTVADGSVDPSLGVDHRARTMELLGRSDFGEVSRRERPDVDVAVLGDEDGDVVVRMGDHETNFEALVGAPGDGATAEPEPEPESAGGGDGSGRSDGDGDGDGGSGDTASDPADSEVVA